MSEDSDPERIVVIWSPESRADLRTIDRETALQITGFRLRCGDLPKSLSSAKNLLSC